MKVKKWKCTLELCSLSVMCTVYLLNWIKFWNTGWLFPQTVIDTTCFVKCKSALLIFFSIMFLSIECFHFVLNIDYLNKYFLIVSIHHDYARC